jgi:hypothetical protein
MWTLSMSGAGRKGLSRKEWMTLFLAATFLFGMIARFFPGYQAGFPLNDGGMFLSMIRDLRLSHYVLPSITSYNNLSIPYAYPPFGFYFVRGLSDIFNISEITLLRWLPPAVNTASILAFYMLASLLLESRRRAVVAAIFYALTPGASAWFIMGGGVTRSFGSLFMLLSLWSVYRLFRDGGGPALVLSCLFCALTVVSHPEVGIHTAASCLLIWFFYGRTRRSVLYALVVAVTTVLLSSPWWGQVLAYHGLAPFLSALQTGSYHRPLLAALYSAIFTSESLIPVLVIFRVMGIAWSLWKRNYFLVLWVALAYLIEPRSAPSIVFYPLCMLIAIGVSDVLPAIIDRLHRRNRLEIGPDFNDRSWLTITLLLILVYLFIESSLFGFKLVNTSLSTADRRAMTWIKQNTPAESHFLPITGVPSPEIDSFVEWFPVLAERRSQTTIQGLEWIAGAGFYERYADLAQLQICKTTDCIDEWSARTGLDYQYIVIQKSGVDKKLLASLDQPQKYKAVYSTKEILVYLVLAP